MITVEYLAAVALDIFVYCYYGNQIILQVRIDRLFPVVITGFLPLATNGENHWSRWGHK